MHVVNSLYLRQGGSKMFPSPPSFDYAPRSNASALLKGTFNKSLLDCDAAAIHTWNAPYDDAVRQEICPRRFIMH